MALKITPLHLAILKKGCKRFDTPDARARYREGNFPRADQTKDINMRYRWGIFHAANMQGLIRPSELYEYLDDDHIDSALRSFIPDL